MEKHQIRLKKISSKKSYHDLHLHAKPKKKNRFDQAKQKELRQFYKNADLKQL